MASVAMIERELQGLSDDCEAGTFVPHGEEHFRAEAFSRVRAIVEPPFQVIPESRYRPDDSTRCDLLVCKGPLPFASDLRKALLRAAVEFTCWGGRESPTKLVDKVAADVERLAEGTRASKRFALVHIARRAPFRNHEDVVQKLKRLSRNGVVVLVSSRPG